MDTVSYIAKRRFFHKGQLVKAGDVLNLNSAEAGRLMHLGYVSRQSKPRRALKRDKQYARFTD